MTDLELRTVALELSYELDGVLCDVEHGDGFDDVCLQTVKRVRDRLCVLAAPEPAEPTQERVLQWARSIEGVRVFDMGGSIFGKPEYLQRFAALAYAAGRASKESTG